jgi:hypothetical protein
MNFVTLFSSYRLAIFKYHHIAKPCPLVAILQKHPIMQKIFLIIFTLTTLSSFSQKLDITTIDRSKISATILDSAAKSKLLKQFNGKQDNRLRKKWTARTFLLSDGKVIIEFYDKNAALVNNIEQFKKLEEVRFVKNAIDFLKKNISYKIDLPFEKGKEIIEVEKPKRLTQYRSDMPQWYDFEVYELSTGQILFLDKSAHLKGASIFPDIKTLASENTSVLETVYGSQDDEHLMKALASGDRLSDYDVNDHLIYPKYLVDLIKNHKLALTEQKVYVSDFFGNLYKSANGYYILVDEVNQKNGAGNKMPILSLRIYETLQQVKDAQANYETFKNKGVTSEHFYQKISDKYGEKFPNFVPQLIDALPAILNFDKEQLSFDSLGIDLVDEALKWNGTNYKLFDTWFPPVLAYYGQCYITGKQDGKWTMYFDKENKVWIPGLKLKDGSSAWDWIDFYKDLAEGPIPLRWAGDWDGSRKKMRSSTKTQNNH